MKGNALSHFVTCLRKIALATWVSVIMLMPPLGYAVVHRPFEPVIIESGAFLPGFAGAASNQIKAYRYSALTDTWTLAPLQIDQKTEIRYFTEESDNLENSDDIDDELVFLANDAGDQALEQSWIDDESSRRYPRFEIVLTDPLTNDKSYMYLFRTDQGSDDPGLKDYITYVASADGIQTDAYAYGHNVNGLPAILNIRPEAGGNGINILDRFKIRIKANISILGTKYLTEDNLVPSGGASATVKDGPIRVIRKWNIVASVSSPFGEIKQGTSREIISIFYPHYCDIRGLILPLPEEGASASEVRFSYDFNYNANGMRLYTPANLTGVVTNNSAADGDAVRDITPGWTWWMQTGDPGTALFVGNIPALGAMRHLYYKDQVTGTNDYDQKFADTGDGTSWGDTGFKFGGSTMKGIISPSGQLFMLGPNISPDSAAVIQSMVANPLLIEISSSGAVPVEWTSFTTANQQDKVQISWATASESNNLGFTVERQTGLTGVWQSIGFVQGHGTVSSRQQYEFSDSDLAAGSYQYRLRQIDLDGSFHYSPTRQVDVAAPQDFALLQNYPNPFNPKTTINYRIPQNASGRVTLSIFDRLGRTVATLVNEPARPGYYQHVWDGLDNEGHATGSGVYFYLLSDGQNRRLGKMIKVQ
jgi:hypothetical protein